MKKILFGSAAAIMAVVGFSAFKAHKTAVTEYYWFHVSKTGTPAINAAFKNVNVISYQGTTTSASIPVVACGGTTEFCGAAFLTSQVVTNGSGGFKLITSATLSQLNKGFTAQP